MGLSGRVLLILMCCAMALRAKGYTNYTVGGDLGWYDKLENPKVDYQKWADGKNFSLGDYLIFNTDRNHSVIQTYNVTTYKKCDYDDAEDDDTTQWSASKPTVDKTPVTVAVPLIKEGTNYFFSSDYDGEQCMNGQHFKINVTHGEGLPESLRPEAPAPVSDNDNDSTSDDRFIFNHPHEGNSENGKAMTAESSALTGKGGWGALLGLVNLLLVLWGPIGLFR